MNEIVEAIRSVGPDVWAGLLTDTMVGGIMWLLWGVFLCVAVFIVERHIPWGELREDEDYGAMLGCGIGLGAGGFFGLWSLVYGAMHFIATEAYALKALIPNG